MSSKQIGIEDARKRLGDLIDAAQQGETVILTRHGKPAARLTAYHQETTVPATPAQMDLNQAAARAIAIARENRDMSAAEFDYEIKIYGIGGPHGPIGQAVYTVANGHLPPVEPGDQTIDQREANWVELWEALQPELKAYERRCEARQFANWSHAARSLGKRIRYA
ncbi:prevent-host-death family protein [Micromonospora sp. Llam0]|uniref:type II toxin-antitoxin system Phd/YefM family antitoxin n=1 Tax=Micromonospora sp. Llam0 TaxID=2485143 RepID=UPI000F493D9F|nr:type II toxin-antitoxin system prevent-host-death family antitoxin [Micromonospora sp. Llam0]ROO51094.1 prevent-host-death family protein [Micromonospora sp. Llam0]